MKNKFRVVLIGAALALLLVVLLPVAAMAAMAPVSASGDISSISGTVGFPSGNSGNYKVQSRTVSGNFTSGDLLGPYTFTYKANVDLNTQAGNINGDLTAGSYRFDIDGTSYPVTWTPSAESPVGYVGSSSASGNWTWHDGGGQGQFTCNFSFIPTPDGHIGSILPGSSFTLQGRLNLR